MKIFALACVVGALVTGVATFGQNVKVFTTVPADLGTTLRDGTSSTGLNQRVLVLPVMSSDTRVDPINNRLEDVRPGLLAQLRERFAVANSFWRENSGNQVSFDFQILDRVYQLPRGRDQYHYPSWKPASIIGTTIQGPSIVVPAGTVTLRLHISASDESVLVLNLAAGSPYTFDSLEAAIRRQLSTVGDKIVVSATPFGSDRGTLRLSVDLRYVVAGSFLHVDRAVSSPAVMDVLGLDRPDINLTEGSLTAAGMEFPLTVTAGANFALLPANSAGTSEGYYFYSFPAAATFHNVDELVAVLGPLLRTVTVSNAGGRLQFTVNSTETGRPYRGFRTLGSDERLLDQLGLAIPTESDAVIDYPSRDALRTDANLLVGEGIAAFLINELTLPHSGPDPDPIPNLDITAANQAAIDRVVATHIDPYRSIILVLLDAEQGKRAVASGGYINFGIEHSGYTYQNQTFAETQVDFDTTEASTFTHELGHNIGFLDLYNNSTDYDPNLNYLKNWDVMAAETRLPHTGYWHKQLLAGWMTAGGATVSEFPEPAMFGVPETRRYLITPSEIPAADYDTALAGVPADRTKAKVVRLPIGLPPSGNDHFLTLENRQPGALYSHQLPQKSGAPAPGGLQINDSISPRSFDFFGATTRNVVHPLTDVPLDPDDVVPILDNGTRPDINLLATYPAYDGLAVDIVGSLPGPGTFADRPSYLVDVTRVQRSFLELGITPWNQPPWESPDIWIEHANEPLSPTPLPGNGEPARWSATYDPAANGGLPLNWIRVKVTNSGNVGATAVQLQVKLNTPPGIGDAGTWVSLPLSEPQDIPARESRIFNLPWTPRVNSHTCIQAEIFRWTSPLGDRNPWNNRTQENVVSFFPTSSSPWHPVPFEFEICNNKARDLRVELHTIDLPRGYILDLEQRLLTVPARSRVLVHGKLSLDSSIIPLPTDRQSKPQPGTFHIAGAALEGDYRLPLGGITYRVFPGASMQIQSEIQVDRAGRVRITGETKPVAPNEALEVQVAYPSGKFEWIKTSTNPRGRFAVDLTPKEQGNIRVIVDYPPGGTYVPTTTGETIVDTLVATPRNVLQLFETILIFVLIVLLLLLLFYQRRRSI